MLDLAFVREHPDLIREVARLHGDVSKLVPEMVEHRLKEKLDPAYKLSNRKTKVGRA